MNRGINDTHYICIVIDLPPHEPTGTTATLIRLHAYGGNRG